MTCAGCKIADRCKRVVLVNGTLMALCPPCRRRHDELIAEVPIDGPEDMRAEEASHWVDQPTLPGGLDIVDPPYVSIEGGEA